MKIKDGFTMDLCLESLQKHFPDCSIEKKSGIMGEYIDVKKSFSVGSRIIYRKNKGELNIGSRPNFVLGILVSIFSMTFVDEVVKLLGSEFGQNKK